MIGIDRAQDRTGEQWARVMLEEAPVATRCALLSGWTSLGLRLGAPWSEARVLGWRVQESTPDRAVLAARSVLGLNAELLFQRRPHALFFSTLLQQTNPLARVVWAGIAPGHQQVVRSLLEQAVVSAARGRDPS